MLIGWLDRKPEIRVAPSGRSVAVFTLNIPHSWFSAEGEHHQETEGFHIISWGSLAEMCSQRFTKGDWVYVEGRLQTRHWHDAEDKALSHTEVVAQDLILLDLCSPDSPAP